MSSSKGTKKDYLKFIIPSIFGISIFLTPIVFEDKVTIGMGVLTDLTLAQVNDYLPAFVVGITVLSALLTVLMTLIKPTFSGQKTFSGNLKSLFCVGWPWILFRIIGAIFTFMIFFQIGPEWLWSKETGGSMLYDLASVIVVYFFYASILLPLLTDFGLMEFIGTLLRKFFRVVFRLPGRSAIDAMASWMGSGTVGVLITAQQYKSGFYTQREASVIASNFSIVSVAFCLLIAKVCGVDHIFPQYYLTVVVAGFITAMITSRIPPLSSKKDTYYAPVGRQISEKVPRGKTLFHWGFHQAVERAMTAPGPLGVLKKGLFNALDIWFGLLPSVMAIGTVSLILAIHTPVFEYVSSFFIPLLKLFQLPEAAKAAPAFILGFPDQFLPAIWSKGIESELTRFVIAVMSVIQLIYMSEIGVLILKSEIDLNLFELFIIFMQRTLICLPIIALMAHLLFF